VIGVALIAFDRPEYTRRLLASLEQQTELGGAAFHMFQDGAVNPHSGRVAGNEARIWQVRTLWQGARLPHKREAVCRPQNAGIGIHQFEALEWMVTQYERVLLLEDDVVLSPHWLRLARVLYDQMAEWEDVFSFSLAWKRRCGRGQIARSLPLLTSACGHWWGECLTARNWARVRPYFMPYYELIQDVDYRDRPHDAIIAVYQSMDWDQPYTTQDGAKTMAVWRAGMRRAVTVVNRGIGIGQLGEHYNPVLFRQLGMDDQAPYIFESDATLERFEWAQEAACASRF